MINPIRQNLANNRGKFVRDQRSRAIYHNSFFSLLSLLSCKYLAINSEVPYRLIDRNVQVFVAHVSESWN